MKLLKNLTKVFLVNIGIFLLCALTIEIIFGYWFSEHNFGPYMREHRLKKNPMTLIYQDVKYDYIYKRNYHGFRGEEIDPSLIQAVIIGGSTTDERYKPSEHTITGNLNTLLKSEGYDFKITNAGIEGQTTFGHIYNFKHWFPKLKDFSPKLYIFYIGVNDTGGSGNKKLEENLGGDGHVKNPEIFEVFLDNFKSRSFFYDKLRILKQKYYLTSRTMKYDLKYYEGKDTSDYQYTDYKKALEIHDIKYLKSKYKKNVTQYLNRVEILNNYVISSGSTAIFINQVNNKGVDNENLFINNYSLIEYCKEKNLYCIDLAKKMIGKLDYWFDGVHTSILGSKVIAEIIIEDLIKIIKKENLFSS